MAKVNDMKRISANAITLLKNRDQLFFPLRPAAANKKLNSIAYVGIGISAENAFARENEN